MLTQVAEAARPCVQCAPLVSSGLLEAIKSILSVATLPFGILTFWLGYRQRENERTRSYYQKAVVDEVLPQILTMFDGQCISLSQAGQEALAGIASDAKEIPRSCRIALASFSDKLFELKDAVVQRTSIFDELISRQIEDAFEVTQDDLTAWFEDTNLHKRRHLPEINELLRKHQRGLVRTLFRGKTRSF